MKHLISIFFALVFSVATMAADDNEPKMSFTEKEHDFGMIKESDGPVTYEFEFKNTGNSPLIIMSASGNCGCTRPEFPKEPIKPGEKGKIKVTYNPAGRPGEFNRKVKIRTNETRRRPILKIKGVVIPKNDE